MVYKVKSIDLFDRSVSHKSIEDDVFYESIIKSSAFQRLKNISFLGAIDYAQKTKLKSSERTRYKHSIEVANLILYIATERNYSQELTRHLVVAGLLHDIGHPPLSHSVEPYTQRSFGIGHHQMGEEIILGKINLGQKLSRYLNKNLDINLLIDFINLSSTEDGADLFNSPINIDTIDGINRSFVFMTSQVIDQTYNRKNIARASFLLKDNDIEKNKILDEFWKIKDFVYSQFINSKSGVVADKLSEFYFEKNKGLTIEDLYSSEKEWRVNFTSLFEILNSLEINSSTPSWLLDYDLSYKKRKYTVLSDKLGIERYQCDKIKEKIYFGVCGSCFKQMGLIYALNDLQGGVNK